MRPTLVLLLAALAAVPALAQDPPNCTPGREGIVACFGEKLCECRWAPGGTLTGRPPGHRWDCGALRPACGIAPAGPAPPEPPQISAMPPLPSRYVIPRSVGGAAPRETR